MQSSRQPIAPSSSNASASPTDLKPDRVIDLYEFADRDDVDWDAVGIGALAMLGTDLDDDRAKAA